MRERICQYTNAAIDNMIYREDDGQITIETRQPDRTWQPYHEFIVINTTAVDENFNPDGNKMQVISWPDDLIDDLWLEAPQ